MQFVLYGAERELRAFATLIRTLMQTPQPAPGGVLVKDFNFQPAWDAPTKWTGELQLLTLDAKPAEVPRG